MSFDIYYTIRSNKKSRYQAETLFFGTQWFYDYKSIVDDVFDSYTDAYRYIIDNNLSFVDVHIRKTLSTGGSCTHSDYINWRLIHASKR